MEEGRLRVHIPRLGPLRILVDYEIAKIRNVRLEQAAGLDPDAVQVRFDYEGGAHSLGNTMRPVRKGSASSMPSMRPGRFWFRAR